jgi:hypothetical protein
MTLYGAVSLTQWTQRWSLDTSQTAPRMLKLSLPIALAIGGIDPSVISISSDSHSAQGLADSASSHPQYTRDDILLVCPTCGSYYEVDTQCPLC